MHVHAHKCTRGKGKTDRKNKVYLPIVQYFLNFRHDDSWFIWRNWGNIFWLLSSYRSIFVADRCASLWETFSIIVLVLLLIDFTKKVLFLLILQIVLVYLSILCGSCIVDSIHCESDLYLHLELKCKMGLSVFFLK